MSKGLGATQRRILDYLGARETATIAEVAEDLGVSYRAAAGSLAKLLGGAYVTREQRAKGAHRTAPYFWRLA